MNKLIKCAIFLPLPALGIIVNIAIWYCIVNAENYEGMNALFTKAATYHAFVTSLGILSVTALILFR